MRLAAPSLALLLSGTALAQPANQATPAFTAAAVRGHVEFLADDALEGRGTGTRGFDIAARYVATRFEMLGLKPAAGDEWYQPIKFVEAALGTTPAAVTIGGKRFANAGDVLVGPTAKEPSQKVEGAVVFAGYGLDLPGQGFDDYAGLEARGKFVAVLQGFPKGTPSELGAHLNAEKARMAEARGAIGVITVPTIQSIARRPWATTVKNAGHPTVTWIGDDGQPYSAAPKLRTAATVNGPAAEALFAGARTSLKAVLALADKTGGKPKGFALKPAVTIERVSTTRTISSPNVLAVLPGSDPALAGEYVVLMAHLDHIGVDEGTEGDRINNGAMDNAAGIATMLEVARAFAESGQKPRRPILFAAVTGEEKGLLGSQYLAKHPVVGGGKVVGVVNLDMPILLYDFQDVIAFGAEHSTLGPIVAKAAGAMNVKLSPDPLPAEGLFTRSDHYRFVQEGVPSVFLMTGFAGEGQKKFEDFLATHYHKPSDSPALPFDWQAGAKFAEINYRIAREIADAAEAPRWYAKDFFGDTFAPSAPKAAATK